MTTTTEARQHTLHITDNTGDTRMTWDSEVDAEVDAAGAMFDSLKAQGYLAYMVDPEDGSKGTVIQSFDPDAEAIIMSPQLVGG